VELYAYRYATEEQIMGRLGDRLIEILMSLPPQIITQESHNAVGVLGTNQNYLHLFLRLLSDDENREHTIESLLDQLERRPPLNLYQERAKLRDIGEKIARHYLWKIPSLIETLTACGAWNEAATMVKNIYDAIEDTTQHKARRQHVALYRIACDFEASLENARADALDDLGGQWRSTLADIEKRNAENTDRKHPF
jgi:hypothetical protein